MHSFWGQGELNSWCLFTITPFWKLTLTNVNIELLCVIIALALEDWPSHRQSICYVITLLRTLFCKQYFFSRTVMLLRYYERFSLNSIFISRPVTLLRYYERFSVNSIFLSRLLRCYAITSAFLWTVFFQSTCYVVTLLRALSCKQYFFSRTVTLLRYYERFSVKSIFLSRLLRCYAITSAFLWAVFFRSTCYDVTLLRALSCKQYFLSRTITLLRYYERFSVKIIFLRVDLLRYCERFSYYLSRPVTLQRQLITTTFTVFIMRYSYNT